RAGRTPFRCLRSDRAWFNDERGTMNDERAPFVPGSAFIVHRSSLYSMGMRLAVNIDHIATIREARKTDEPDPVAAAVICELAGGQRITVHLRGDRRHIQERDVELLRKTVSTHLNIEMAANPEMVRIAQTIKP